MQSNRSNIYGFDIKTDELKCNVELESSENYTFTPKYVYSLKNNPICGKNFTWLLLYINIIIINV